jgi:hypothetical protein
MPDRRYFVLRGRIWRMANPDIAEEKRRALAKPLMAARGPDL